MLDTNDIRERAPLAATVWADDAGATLVEYGFIVMLIAIASVAAVALFGSKVAALFPPLFSPA